MTTTAALTDPLLPQQKTSDEEVMRRNHIVLVLIVAFLVVFGICAGFAIAFMIVVTTTNLFDYDPTSFRVSLANPALVWGGITTTVTLQGYDFRVKGDSTPTVTVQGKTFTMSKASMQEFCDDKGICTRGDVTVTLDEDPSMTGAYSGGPVAKKVSGTLTNPAGGKSVSFELWVGTMPTPVLTQDPVQMVSGGSLDDYVRGNGFLFAYPSITGGLPFITPRLVLDTPRYTSSGMALYNEGDCVSGIPELCQLCPPVKVCKMFRPVYPPPDISNATVSRMLVANYASKDNTTFYRKSNIVNAIVVPLNSLSACTIRDRGHICTDQIGHSVNFTCSGGARPLVLVDDGATWTTQFASLKTNLFGCGPAIPIGSTGHTLKACGSMTIFTPVATSGQLEVIPVQYKIGAALYMNLIVPPLAFSPALMTAVPTTFCASKPATVILSKWFKEYQTVRLDYAFNNSITTKQLSYTANNCTKYQYTSFCDTVALSYTPVANGTAGWSRIVTRSGDCERSINILSVPDPVLSTITPSTVSKQSTAQQTITLTGTDFLSSNGVATHVVIDGAKAPFVAAMVQGTQQTEFGLERFTTCTITLTPEDLAAIGLGTHTVKVINTINSPASDCQSASQQPLTLSITA